MKFSIIILLILFIGCTSKEDFSFNKETEIKISSSVLKNLKGGEIILRKGRGYLSTLIVDLLGEELSYSHAGIIIKDSNKLYIIHILSDDVSNVDGVQTCSVKEFLSDISDSSLCIVKPNVDSLSLLKIQEKAQKYLKAKVPFDHEFDMNSKDKLHCSELVHDVLYQSLNKELLPITNRFGVDIIKFSAFFNQENFQTIFELKPYSKSL